MRSKLARKVEFTAKARRAIHERDRETCVFCAMGYRLPKEARGGLQIMHIVPRSQMGMGVEENGALGCIWHHTMLDNGNEGRRAEMLAILEGRMREYYPGWSREMVTYRKYRGACGTGEETRAAAGGASRPAGTRPTESAGDLDTMDPGDGFRLLEDVDKNVD